MYEEKWDAYYERNIPYKMDLDTLYKRMLENSPSYEKAWYRDEDVIAYIRYKGDKFRCKAKSAVRGIMTPLGLMHSTDDEEMVLCRLVTAKDGPKYTDSSYNPLVEKTFHDDSWYSAYKLSLTPVEFEGCIDSYYVSDFVSLINEGYIEIWEFED